MFFVLRYLQSTIFYLFKYSKLSCNLEHTGVKIDVPPTVRPFVPTMAPKGVTNKTFFWILTPFWLRFYFTLGRALLFPFEANNLYEYGAMSTLGSLHTLIGLYFLLKKFIIEISLDY